MGEQQVLVELEQRPAKPRQAVPVDQLQLRQPNRIEQDLTKRYLYWESHARGFHQAARRGDWKAVRHGVDQPMELYNLAKDVSEKNDVGSTNPKVVQDFAEYFRTGRTDDPNYPLK